MEPQELRDLQEYLKFNNAEMGIYLGVTGAAIGLWLSGKNRIPESMAKLIKAKKAIITLRDEIAQLHAVILTHDKPDPVPEPPIPHGLCNCGCGQKTMINHRTQTAKGWVKGEPRSYITGHNLNTASIER